MIIFDKGDRVVTPQGAGTVVYKRMAAPNYATVLVYSVALDSKVSNDKEPNYVGTLYPAKEVQKL